jgi:hypothetical protein
MSDTFDAIVAGIVLVLASMIAGGIIYVVARDAITCSLDRNDQEGKLECQQK